MFGVFLKEATKEISAWRCFLENGTRLTNNKIVTKAMDKIGNEIKEKRGKKQRQARVNSEMRFIHLSSASEFVR